MYISYNGLGEPLVHSQVLPYLAGLVAAGHEIFLLTYERRGAGASYDEQQHRAAADLAKIGVRWRALTYHRWPSFTATLYDVLRGFASAVTAIRRDRVAAIHARSYVPAVIGWWARRLFGVRFVFDMRGLMADEYVDAGNWKAAGSLYRLTKSTERRMIAAADEVVVLTHRVKAHLVEAFSEIPDLSARTTVVPCCVDDSRFALPAEPRSGEGVRLVYVGSVGTWYLLDEMLDFFAAGASTAPGSSFLWLNQHDHAVIRAAAAKRGLPPEVIQIAAVRPDEVPARLSGAHVGVSFIKPTFSKRASSPTKFAEYLAAGLPVVTNTGVGDLDDIVRKHRIGIVVQSLTPDGYRRAWRELAELRRDPGLALRCRRVAEEEFSVRVGVALYQAVYARLEKA